MLQSFIIEKINSVVVRAPVSRQRVKVLRKMLENLVERLGYTHYFVDLSGLLKAVERSVH